MLARVKFFVFVFQLLLAANAQKIKKEMSLAGPFMEEEILQNWDMMGETEAQISSIRLTSAKPGVRGGIWSKHPNLSNKWEMQMNFRISGEGLQSGEGIAIWYTRDSMKTGPVFGSRDYFSGLGIFIDSVLDEDDEQGLPYIYGIINNGSLRFLDSLRIGECQAAARNIIHWTKIAISYSSNTLTVYVDNEGKNKWKLCFVSPGVHLPTAYRLGVTASTTEFSDLHEIISLTTLDLDETNKLWEDRGDIIPYAENVLMPIHPSKEDLIDDDDEFEVEDEENELQKARKEEIEKKLKEELRREAEERNKREEMAKTDKLLREKQQKEGKERLEREEKEKQLKEEKEKQLKEEKERRRKEEKERQEKEEKEKQRKEEKEKQMKAQKEAKEMLRKEKEKEEEPEMEETPPVPFIRKAIYVLGTLLILVIIIKVYKKYSTQRREAQHKRLY